MKTNIKNNALRLPTTAVIAILCMLLTACDGGIFGTGDGDPIDPISGSGDGSTSSTQTPGTSDTTGDTTGDTTSGTDGMTGGMADGSTTEAMGADTSSTIAFQNMQPGGSSSTPRLRVLNVSTGNVSIAANEVNNFIVNGLAPEQDTGLLNIPIDTSSLLVIDTTNTGDPNFFHVFDPFDAAAFSVTTVIVRDQIADGSGVLALSSQTESNSMDTALVRLVQANTLGDATATATITLFSAAQNSSGSDVSFEGLSYEQGATEYTVVIPGSYTLSDGNSRFADTDFTIESGRVYTVVIVSPTAPSTRVLEETQ